MDLGKQVYYPKIGIIPISLLVSAIVIFVMFLYGAYKNESSLLNVQEIKSVFKGISVSFLLFATILVFGQINISRYVLVFSYATSVLTVVIARCILYHFLPLTNLFQSLKRRILIYGAGELGSALFREIANSPRLGLVPVGFIGDDPAKAGCVHCSSGFSNTPFSVPVLGRGDDLREIIKRYGVDEVCLAISNISSDHCIKILERLKKQNVKTSFVPNLYKVFVHRVNIRHLGHIPIVQEDEGDVRKTYMAIKRPFCAVFSLFF